MSGEEKLETQSGLTVEEQLKKITGVVNKYKTNLKLNCIDEFDDDVSEWLNASQETLSCLTQDHCYEIAHTMLRYHTFLTRHITEEKVKLKTVKSIINKWASSYWPKYQKVFMDPDMKLELIAERDNFALQEPIKMKNWIELRIASIQDLAACAKDHYHFYMNYAKCKQ